MSPIATKPFFFLLTKTYLPEYLASFHGTFTL